MRQKHVWGLLLVTLALLVVIGCNKQGDSGGNEVQAASVTVIDFEGRTVSINARPERIISLAPISTRVIAQFGLLNNVIGVDQKSYTMDLLPEALSERGLPITDLGNARSINEEAILRLQPDIVITQYDKAQADLLSQRIGVPVVCIQNRGDIAMDYELFEILGKVLFASAQADAMVTYMQTMVDRAKTFAEEHQGIAQPLVYVATDTSLLNTFPNDFVIRLCGGRNVAAEISTMNYWGGATVDTEFLVRAKPDIIVLWIAFTSPQKIAEFRETISKREFADIPAIINSRIYTSLSGDGKDFFYTMTAISEALHMFYPDAYTAQMLEQDTRAHLQIFFPDVTYEAYREIRDMVQFVE